MIIFIIPTFEYFQSTFTILFWSHKQGYEEVSDVLQTWLSFAIRG